MLRARDLVRLLRPHQWVKNGFVLAGLVFGHGWDDARTVALALSAFVAFCLASSAVYPYRNIHSKSTAPDSTIFLLLSTYLADDKPMSSHSR